MRVLGADETADILQRHGLNAPVGAGFAFHDSSRNTQYDWHRHDYHQLLYALAGGAQIETEEARFLLPMQGAAWIPAGLRHRTLTADIDGVSLYFAPASVSAPGDRLRILRTTPVMREMILHSLRWPRGASEIAPVAASFFTTLALMCVEWMESELPFGLPRATHPGISRAMDGALADLSAATFAGALAAAHLSERTFRRVFYRETGINWKNWLTQARILAAMSRLAKGMRVTDVAAEVGFASLSAFASAFRQISGENPADYRRRIGV